MTPNAQTCNDCKSSLAANAPSLLRALFSEAVNVSPLLASFSQTPQLERDRNGKGLNSS
ncbi:MAG: hypothetical protein AAFW95_13340 [Cyanobacteria bacterium J06638_6]